MGPSLLAVVHLEDLRDLPILIAKVISSIPREVYPLWEALRLADVGKRPKGFRSSSSVIVCPLEKQRRSRAERGREDCPTLKHRNWCVSLSAVINWMAAGSLSTQRERERGREGGGGSCPDSCRQNFRRRNGDARPPRAHRVRGAGALAPPLREMIVSPSDPANGDSAVSSDEDTCPPLLLRMCVGGTPGRRGEQRRRPRKRRRVGQTQLPLRKCLDE